MIAAYQGISWLSRAIRFRTDSEYSHVAHINDKTGVCIEAWWPGGVRAVANYRIRHTRGTVVDLFQLKDRIAREYAEEAVWGWLQMQLGKSYDIRGILRFLTRGKEHDTDNPFDWFCSRMEFTAWHMYGIQLLERVPSYKIDPGDIPKSPLLESCGTVRV